MKFTFLWLPVSRNPTTVTFPDGTIETVQYMRDGICLFMSGKSATYERTGQHEAEFTMNETLADVEQAITNYKAKQP